VAAEQKERNGGGEEKMPVPKRGNGVDVGVQEEERRRENAEENGNTIN